MRTLVAGAEGPWEVPDAIMLVVLVASALSAGLAATRHRRTATNSRSGRDS